MNVHSVRSPCTSPPCGVVSVAWFSAGITFRVFYVPPVALGSTLARPSGACRQGWAHCFTAAKCMQLPVRLSLPYGLEYSLAALAVA
jgi:hypothetical protein